jgi:hypothetical protein
MTSCKLPNPPQQVQSPPSLTVTPVSQPERLPLVLPLNCDEDNRPGVRYYDFEVQWS